MRRATLEGLKIEGILLLHSKRWRWWYMMLKFRGSNIKEIPACITYPNKICFTTGFPPAAPSSAEAKTWPTPYRSAMPCCHTIHITQSRFHGSGPCPSSSNSVEPTVGSKHLVMTINSTLEPSWPSRPKLSGCSEPTIWPLLSRSGTPATRSKGLVLCLFRVGCAPRLSRKEIVLHWRTSYVGKLLW